MEYVVQELENKVRLDMYLINILEDMTRSYIKTLIEDGKILVNNKIVKSGYLLKPGDKIYVESINPVETNITAEDIKLDIVYEDDDLLIINKEKGMVVHPGANNYTGTMVNALLYSHLNKLSAINGVIRPGIVHRIDKDTTGLLVVAKNDNAHKVLSEQFKEHSITREYRAIVNGIIKEDKFTVDLPIGRSTKDRKKMAVTLKNSKRAVTHVEVLQRFLESKLTYIKVNLDTGRTHQIRVHMATKGHPLLGDVTYSKSKLNLKYDGQVLHAKKIGFIHPSTNKYVEFDSNLPKEFEEILNKLEKKENN